MPTREYTLANGQLAASAGTILAGTSLPPNLNGCSVAVSCTNTAATSETVILTLQVAGGTARRIARAVLAQNEELLVTGLPMQPDDTLLGVTTNASAVDYVVMRDEGGPFSKQTMDANGAIKTASSSSPGLVAGFVVADNTMGAFGTDSDFRFSYDTTDANAASLLLQVPTGGGVTVPAIVIGQAIESVDLGLYNGTVDPTICLIGVGAVTSSPILDFRKARGTAAAPTAITTGDDLGMIRAFSCVAAAEYVESVRVTLDSTGTIATTRGAGQFKVAVATDAAPSVLTQRLLITGSADITLTPATDVLIANGTGLVIGHTAQITANAASEFQVLGTALADGSAIIGVAAASAVGPELNFSKSRNAAIGTNTIVQDNDEIGKIVWLPDDGVDYATEAMVLVGEVDDASPAAGDVGMALVLKQMPGGGGALEEHLRVEATGSLILNQQAQDVVHLSLRSSDVATVLTTIVTGTVTTSDYFTVQKFAAATGGAVIQALGENAAVTSNLRIESYGGQADATKSTAARGLIEMYASQHDGANALADIGADGNALVVIVRRGGADVAGFIVDEDGEIHSDVAAATFDEHDDLQLVRAFDHGKRGFVQNRWDSFVEADEQYLIDIGVLGAPKAEGGLVNHCRLLQLHNGALWQLASEFMDVVAVLAASVPGVKDALPARIQQRLALAA